MNSYKHYLPAFFTAGVLFYLSSLPASSVPTLGIRFEDLFMHVVAYSVFGFTLGLAGMHPDVAVTRTRIILTILFGICYGISDEFHQSFVPGRESTVLDVLADAVGVTCGVIVYLHKNRK